MPSLNMLCEKAGISGEPVHLPPHTVCARAHVCRRRGRAVVAVHVSPSNTLSDDVAGATFMAAGASSPEMFAPGLPCSCFLESFTRINSPLIMIVTCVFEFFICHKT